MGGFGHAIGLDHRRAEGCVQRRHHLRGQRGRGRAQEPQRRVSMIPRHCARRGPGWPDAWWARRCTRSAAPPSIQAKNCSALKPGAHQIDAPAASEAETAAIRPWIWNSGITFRQRSAGVRSSDTWMCSAEAQIFDWSSGTILGRDVVPEVCRIRATSSVAGRRGIGGAAWPFAGQREICPPVRTLRHWTAARWPCPPCRRSKGGAVVIAGHDKRLGLEVGQVEVVFLFAVGRVERRGCRHLRDGDKGGGHFGPVGQHDRHAVAAPDADTLQRRAHLVVKLRNPP